MTDYEVTRSAVLPCDIGRLHALLDDFEQWRSWSPWEGLDPHMSRTYSGMPSGVGARYAWSGSRRAGSGAMEIVDSRPDRIEVELEFREPFKSRSTVRFDLVTVAEGTQLTWTHTGSVGGLMGLMFKVYPMERAIAPDMEKGLTNLAKLVMR